MKRWVFVLPLAAGLGCAGHGPATSGPAPETAAAASAGSASLPGDSAVIALSDSASPDTLDPETAADLRAAADSAADAAVLEQLDSASAEVADRPSDHSTASGGAKTVGNSGVTWDIDVESFTGHDRVQYYLDFFQGPARDRMAVWLQRMPRYEPMIRRRLAERGLPGDLVYLALIESGFSNSAVSRSRAVGMWQFMKGTARLYGLRIDSWVDERRDPYKATIAAAHHLADLRDRFGSLYLAAAAYNAGAGRVTRGLRRLPDDDEDSLYSDATFFRLYDSRSLRRETKDYVPKLIAAALIAKEPERYGFDPETPVDPTTWDSITVTGMTGLDVIARLADTTVAVIRNLNPEYLRLATPPGARSVIRLPAGRGPGVAAAYARLPANQRVSFVEHFVKRGETYGHIARRYHVSVRDLEDANPRVRPTQLRVGQRIVVPTSGVSTARAAAAAEERSAAVHRSVSSTHRVRSGETLSGIAVRYHVSVGQLRAWNGLRGSAIRAGQVLRVVGGSHPAAGRTGARVYVVRRGDTLSGIAQRYGVSVAALQDANELGSSSTIRAGARLRIPR